MDFAGVQAIARGDDFEFPELHRRWVGRTTSSGNWEAPHAAWSAASSGCLVRTLFRAADGGRGRDGISIACSGGRGPNVKELAHRVTIAPDFLANVRALITPGTTLVLPTHPLTHARAAHVAFNILTDKDTFFILMNRYASL